MKKLILVFTLIAISSVIVFGQDDDYKKGEFFVGYSRNQVDSGIEPGDIPGDPIDKREGFNGFEVSGVYNVSRYVGVKGDFSGTYRNDSFSASVPDGTGGTSNVSFDTNRSVYNALGGVQFKDNSSDAKVKPFAHLMGGIGINRIKVKNVNCTLPGTACSSFDAIEESESGFAGAFGGGLDIKLNDRVDLRAIQVDYNPIRLDGVTQNNIRFGIGFVFK